MAGMFLTLLAVGFGIFVLCMVWSLLNRGAKSRRASLDQDTIDNSARDLISRYGSTADLEASKLSEQCLAIGDFEGEAVWKLVKKAISRLQS